MANEVITVISVPIEEGNIAKARVCTWAVRDPTAADTFKIISRSELAMQCAGMIPLAVFNDSASENTKAYKAMFKLPQLVKGSLTEPDVLCVCKSRFNPNRFFHGLHDFPHAMKGVRNNFGNSLEPKDSIDSDDDDDDDDADGDDDNDDDGDDDDNEGGDMEVDDDEVGAVSGTARKKKKKAAQYRMFILKKLEGSIEDPYVTVYWDTDSMTPFLDRQASLGFHSIHPKLVAQLFYAVLDQSSSPKMSVRLAALFFCKTMQRADQETVEYLQSLDDAKFKKTIDAILAMQPIKKVLSFCYYEAQTSILNY